MTIQPPPSLPAARLANQQLLRPRFNAPKDVVAWMGAMQAQDFKSALQVVSIRLPGTTAEAVEAAFQRSEILRTHVLRPTWHFVSPDDIRWMLALTGARVKAQAHARDVALGLTEAIFAHGAEVIARALQGGKFLSRDELARVLEDAGVDTGEYRIAHLLMRAELDAMICSGPTRGKTQTYALLDERAPCQKTSFDREQAMTELTRRYFTSHGPATLKDFAWWSGLGLTEIRRGVEANRARLSSFEAAGQTYFFAPPLPEVPIADAVHFLPAFDEYIIAYADRSAVLASAHHSKAVSSNGVFRPTILRGGLVVGTWKNAGKKIVESYFESAVGMAE